jgi:hypothetical protein
VAQPSVVRPLGEGHLGDQLRSGPVHTRAHEFPGRAFREGGVRQLEGGQLPAQLPQQGLGKTGTDLSGEDQLRRIVVAPVIPDEQRAQALARALRLGVTADDEFLAADAFGFQPARAAAAAVGLAPALGHDPFEPAAARLFQEGLPVSHHVIGKLDGKPGGGGGDQVFERRLACLERLPPQVAAIEVQQIENVVHRPRSLATEGVLQRLKAGPPVGQRHRHLTVEQGRSCRQLRHRGAHRGELRGPVMGPAAEQAHPALLRPGQDAIPVELELVNPVVPLRCLRDQGGELWLDERGKRRGRGFDGHSVMPPSRMVTVARFRRTGGARYPRDQSGSTL